MGVGTQQGKLREAALRRALLSRTGVAGTAAEVRIMWSAWILLFADQRGSCWRRSHSQWPGCRSPLRGIPLRLHFRPTGCIHEVQHLVQHVGQHSGRPMHRAEEPAMTMRATVTTARGRAPAHLVRFKAGSVSPGYLVAAFREAPALLPLRRLQGHRPGGLHRLHRSRVGGCEAVALADHLTSPARLWHRHPRRIPTPRAAANDPSRGIAFRPRDRACTAPARRLAASETA
jgi:hypothetical protein